MVRVDSLARLRLLVGCAHVDDWQEVQLCATLAGYPGYSGVITALFDVPGIDADRFRQYNMNEDVTCHADVDPVTVASFCIPGGPNAQQY